MLLRLSNLKARMDWRSWMRNGWSPLWQHWLTFVASVSLLTAPRFGAWRR